LGKEEEEYASHERAYGERGDLVLLEGFYRESAKLHEASVKRWEVLKAKSMELDREGRMVEEMLDSLLRDEGEWRRDLGSSEDRLGLLRVRGEEILGERKVFEGRLEALEGEKQGILEEMKESTAKREEAERIVEEVEKRERIFEEGRREREKVYIELKEQVARVRTHKEMWKDRLEEARVAYEEREGLDSEFALEEGVSLEDLEGMIEDFRDKRDRLGSINLLALDELGEKEREHEDRLRQIEDVRAAAEALQVSCKDLEREAGEKFLLIFGEINDYFQEHFSRIFGGGRAQLRLSREGDILGSGVEIEVEFLGKRVSTLSLLSGGEQALVALCLMFAMFRVHRAPLYVLDEVDAALDDVNVGKFCELMKMSGEEWGMRFLVVTHHRLTMAMADRLFGVTMVEKGVSKLVAVDVEEAVDRWSLEGGVMEEGVVG
jgi:chromosome segregation protein